MNIHESYMRRCLDIAVQGLGYVAPNPMVGAVLVHGDKIIGEGAHRVYGGPHAEVNCLDAVLPENMQLISSSSLYVSLEPCAHFGKTPPCADLIIRYKIPRVFIGCTDPFSQVSGKGLERLRSAGVLVETGILEKECRDLNKRFFTFHIQRRPYIILKWAQTADGKIGNAGNNRLKISAEITDRLVHKWRSEEMGVMIGTQTALADNPMLNNRLWTGSDPVRIIIDRELSLPVSLRIFDGASPTIIFNTVKQEDTKTCLYYRLAQEKNLLPQIIEALYNLNILSVMVEGGAKLTQSFIDQGLWDEIKVITNNTLIAGEGVEAPGLTDAQFLSAEEIAGDTIAYYINSKTKTL